MLFDLYSNRMKRQLDLTWCLHMPPTLPKNTISNLRGTIFTPLCNFGVRGPSISQMIVRVGKHCQNTCSGFLLTNVTLGSETCCAIGGHLCCLECSNQGVL